MSTSDRARSLGTTALALVLVLGSALPLAGCFAPRASAPTSAVSGGAARATAVGTPPGAAGSVPGGTASSPAASSEKGAAAVADKLVVVTKTMRLQVDDVNGTLTKIRAMTAAAGGDITALQVSTNSDQPVYSDAGASGTAGGSSAPLQAFVTVRVPAKGYAAFIDRAAKLGRVIFQSESSEDVTQQHVDMKARLRNLQAEEVRFRQFLKQARNVSDALKVERELERVRGEIESLQAQILYLERQAAMATVTLELAEPQPIVRPAGVDWGFGQAITTGIQGMTGLLQVVIVVVIATAPLWIGGALIAWLIVSLVRRRRARRNAAAADSADSPSVDPMTDSPVDES